MKLPAYLKPALGIVVGLIGFYNPYLFGVGYEAIDQVLLGNIGLFTLMVLLLVKILATLFTLGSGGSGGIFTPSLFMGAMLGGLFGEIRCLCSGKNGSSFCRGCPPITSFFILFEMTRDYAIIPYCWQCWVALYLLATLAGKLYTLKLT